MTLCRLCGGDPDAEVLASWVMRLPIAVPSQNAVGSNRGSAKMRATYRRWRDVFVLFVRTFKRTSQVPDARMKRRVRIVREYSGREHIYDKGNLVGGTKMLVDALVMERILVDDSEKCAEIHYAQQRSAETAVSITVEEIE